LIFGWFLVWEKLAEQKAEDALKIGPFMVPHMCVCVSAKFLKFYDRMAARAKNAKSAAPSTTESAKTFMLISTHRKGGGRSWAGLALDSASSGKLSQYPNTVDTVSKKCLFRIWQSVIYGPITFNFTCGPLLG